MKYLFGSLALGCILLTHMPVANADRTPATAATAPASSDAGYDRQNPFARILRGELPAYKVYEDNHVLAFLSLDQTTPGHVLVISKTSNAQNIMQMSARDLPRVMLVVQRIARAQIRALHADGVVIWQNNGTAADQTVFHLHVHVEPRWDNETPGFARDSHGKLDRTALAARIAAAIGP
jgi:histidine triad (HIT) family protein